MGTVAKLKISETPACELPRHLIADADRPEHRYLGSELLLYLTSGKLPREALKDYAVLRWAFQAHAYPAMMLSHAAFLEGELNRSRRGAAICFALALSASVEVDRGWLSLEPSR